MLVLIGVDTNVLIDHAEGDEDVIGALEVIKERLPGARLIVTPTVLEELGYLCDHGEPEEAEVAERALSSLFEWGYEPLNIIPAGMGITEQIGLKLRLRGIIPDEEENDALIVAEAALLGCTILLSSDHHLLDAQENPKFLETLKEASVEGDKLVIATPRKIATQYFRRR